MNMQARVSDFPPNIGFSANGERAEKDKGPQMRNVFIGKTAGMKK